MEPSTPRIRAVALGVVWRGDELLVVEGGDPVKGGTFFRPPGGTIEFGEPARATLVREFREELAALVEVGRQVAIVENIFVFNGETGHEVVFLFETTFADSSFYARDELPLDEEGIPFTATWRPLDAFADPRNHLVPEGLYEILSRQRAAG